jgi:hypothetical protein
MYGIDLQYGNEMARHNIQGSMGGVVARQFSLTTVISGWIPRLGVIIM